MLRCSAVASTSACAAIQPPPRISRHQRQQLGCRRIALGVSKIEGRCFQGRMSLSRLRASFDEWTEIEGTLAPYQGSAEEVVSAALAFSGLKPGERLVDLGAGDGRVLIAAIADCGASEAVGRVADPWEIDPELCALAEENLASRLRSQAGRARVVCGDARTADVRGADVVLLYMLPEANAVLAREVLEPQLPAGCGARVVAHTFDVPGWMPSAVKTIDRVKLYLYER